VANETPPLAEVYAGREADQQRLVSIAAGVLELLGVNLEKARRETIRVLTERDGGGNA